MGLELCKQMEESSFGSFLGCKPTEFDDLNIRCEEEGIFRDNFLVCLLGNWVDGG